MQSEPAVAAVHSHKEFVINCLGKFALGAVLACVVSSCSSRPKLDYEVVSEPQLKFEAINPGDQALEEILKTPTQFVQNYPNAQYAWDRAQMFFKDHTSRSKFVAGPGGEIGISNRNSTSDPFIYDVTRRDVPTGAQFTLRCMPRTGNANDRNAELNCKNLARFIRDGTLESGLLVR